MKYVIIQWMGSPAPVVFPCFLLHETFKGHYPTSAGFLKINDKGEVETFGESISLHLKSNPNDAILVGKLLNHEISESSYF